MSSISDADLMAYADGVLPRHIRPLVRKAILQDPELLEKLEGYIITSRSLAAPFERLPPVPMHVRRLIAKPHRDQDFGERLRMRLADFLRSARLGDSMRVPVWSLAAVPLVLCAALLVWLMLITPGPAHQLADLRAQGLLLSSPFQRALENVESGVQTQLAALKPTGTFLSNKNEWCRQYELLQDEGVRLGGVACRGKEGEWRVRASVPLLAAATRQTYAPAGEDPGKANDGAAEALEGAVDGLIKGIVLLPTEERKLITGGWQAPR